METVLELKGVSKTLGKRKVVDNVSFEVKAGEIFGFLGPNGAGKTTTIKMIAGLLKPDAGDVFICGNSVRTKFEKALENVGGIIENPEMYEYMSGRKNLKVFGSMNGNFPKERYDEVISMVKLDNRIDEKVKKYSLGMRQRLGVAQALLHNPKLLILDEPTNGLDPAGIKELRNTLREMAVKDGLAVLVSSHLLSEMELMCDRFGIIDKGVLTDVKSLVDIRSTKDKALIDYTFDVSDINGARNIIEGVLNEKSGIHIAENELKLQLSREKAADIVEALVKNNVRVYGVTAAVNTLEDEFIMAIEDHKGQIS